MHMKSIFRFVYALAVTTVFAFPTFAFAFWSFSTNSSGGFQFSVGSGNGCGLNNLCQVASTFLFIINGVLVPLLFAVAFIVFLYGVAKTYIFSRGDLDEVKTGHQLILWGIVGFVVMISLWGLVNVVANTFGLAGYSAPYLPQS